MEVVRYPHPTLRYKSKPIRRVNAELRKIVEQMFENMYESEGIGLAANQVGLPLRLFLMNLQSDPQEGEEFVFINPILSRPKGSIEKEEGCLSFPEVYVNVERAERIKVTYTSLENEETTIEADGLLARAIQHELDHLNGVLLVDHMSPVQKVGVAGKLKRLKKQGKAQGGNS